MLLNFRVQNLLSFKDEINFSMECAKTVKDFEDTENSNNSNVFHVGNNLRTLKFSAVYGGNSSGKTNLLKCINWLKNIVLLSSQQDDLIKKLWESRFLLDAEQDNKPCSLEISFILNHIVYRYGFEIFHGKVLTEWLNKKAEDSKKESYVFSRENNNIKLNPRFFKGAKRLFQQTRKNALFLSTCAQFNISEAQDIKDWFRKKLLVILSAHDLTIYTIRSYLGDPQVKDFVRHFVSSVDSGIKGIEIVSSPTTLEKIKHPFIQAVVKSFAIPDELQETQILTSHVRQLGDSKKDLIKFPFDYESEGTKKVFALSAPLFNMLQNGGVLLIDEFSANLHTSLSKQLIDLFQKNSRGAQLIIATHDTNLLSNDFLRRDQIWFTEKNEFGASTLYSLVEYKVNQLQSVRKDASFQKDYLIGKYGAIPFLGNVKNFMNQWFSKESSIRE